MSDTKTDLSVLTVRTRLPAALRNASGMQKLDWILGQPAPAEIVQALAPHELYYWLRDIGKEDAYPLLEYATEDQFKGLVDLDTWNRHELSIPRWLDWLDLALAVGDDTAQRFVTAQDDELLEYLVTGDVQVLPADTDLDTIPDTLAFFHSPDFLYVVTVPRDHPLEERMPQLMQLLWSADTDRARAIFQQAQFELHISVSEDLERFRTARLQDLGFESVTDALEVYSTLPVRQLRSELEAARGDEVRPPTTAPDEQQGLVADLVLRGVEPPDLLRAAVSALGERDRRTFGNGFAYLTNKVFMAETGDLARLDDLPDAAQQAAALANLGLAYLSYEFEPRASEVVRQVTPETLFRTGWTHVFDIARKARRLAARAGVDRGFDLFGSPTAELIQAASQLRPRYADAIDEPGALGSRPFSTMAELARVEAHLEEASSLLDTFEDHFGLTLTALEEGDLPGLAPDARRRIRLTTLVRTGLLHALLHDEFSFTPVGKDELVAFSRAAFEKDASLTPRFRERLDVLVAAGALGSATAAAAPDFALREGAIAGAGAPAIREAKEGDAADARDAFAALVTRAVDELVESLGPVRADDVDLRYAGELFLVRTAATTPQPTDAH